MTSPMTSVRNARPAAESHLSDPGAFPKSFPDNDHFLHHWPLNVVHCSEEHQPPVAVGVC